MQVGLLLHAARVGEAQPGAEQERGEVAVAERGKHVHGRLERLHQAIPLERRARARVQRQHDRLGQRAEPLDDASRGSAACVFDWRWTVASR